MEESEPLNRGRIARHVAGGFIAGIKFVKHQLATADLNLPEGRLRGSIMPAAEYMQIPDTPAAQDEIIQ